VRPAGRQRQRPARSSADQPALGIQRIEQREEVVLVRAAPVEQHERPRGLARSGPHTRSQRHPWIMTSAVESKRLMQFEGIHHVTCITADAPGNVDFYVRVLGLRLVKKSVNQDDPTVYHLFYADEKGSAGSDLTFFEYPHARRGRAGAGMVHRIVLRVGSDEALAFWEERLAAENVPTQRADTGLRFEDPEGLGLEIAVVQTDDAPLTADQPQIPRELALQGFDGVRAYADPEPSRRLLEETLAFQPTGENTWEVRGAKRGSWYAYDIPPGDLGVPGAGTVHHVAWASPPEEHEAWQERVAAAGAHPTPVIDRFYFKSVYFREPSGVLFEIATIGPGFTVDEPLETLGERLSLPPDYEHLRERVEPLLTPLPNPRELVQR
jgi:glyoxalase family protein